MGLTDPPGVGAQLQADLSPAFGLVSVAYLAAGILLWRRAGEIAGARRRTAP